MPFKNQIIEYSPINEQEENDKKIMLNYINHFYDNILTRENKIAHMTSSGLILNKTIDKVLMIHHNIYNTWTWTGGHADGISDMLEVAIKEAKEETGLTSIEPLAKEIASIDILPVWGHSKKGNYVSAHLHLNSAYILIADENHKLVVNQEETSGVKWIDVDVLSQYSNEPYLIGVYKKIISKGNKIIKQKLL